MRRKLLMAVVAAVTLVTAVVLSGSPAMAQGEQETPTVEDGSEDIGNTDTGAARNSQVLPQLPPLGEQTGSQVAPAQGGFSQIESAQIEQSDAESQPATSETTTLVTSSTEVRRAVVGLIALAGITLLLTVLYWYKTGQQARERHQRQFGGRHRADLHGPVVQDERGPWANDALSWNVDGSTTSVSAYPDGPGGAVALQERPDLQPHPDAAAPYPEQMSPPHTGDSPEWSRPPAEDRPWGSGKPTWPPAPPEGSPPA